MMIHDLSRFRLRKKPHHVDTAIRSLVRSSYEDVACFRSRLDAAGILPGDIGTRYELMRLPPSSREDLPLNGTSEYLRRGVSVSHCYTSQTSGTSGTSLMVTMSQAEAFYRKLLLLRAIYRNTRRRLPLTIVEIGTGEVGIEKRRDLRWIDPVRVIRIPRSLPIPEQRRLLMQTHPNVITGHPSCMELVAESLNGLPSRFAPDLVVSRGEILYDKTRALLERAFGCRVMNYYSCDEIGNIAWECPVERDKLHVNTDGCFVEVVDEYGSLIPNGEEGFVLVTNLFNRTMPFVRYKLGDRVTMLPGGNQRCSCGYTGQSLDLVFGRVDDYCWLPDGRRISPQVIATAIAAATSIGNSNEYLIGQYQVVQEAIDRICVRIVRLENTPADMGLQIAQTIESLGDGITCKVEWVESIPIDSTGKRRKIVSAVNGS